MENKIIDHEDFSTRFAEKLMNNTVEFLVFHSSNETTTLPYVAWK